MFADRERNKSRIIGFHGINNSSSYSQNPIFILCSCAQILLNK